MERSERKSIQEMSIGAKLLCDRLVKAEIGETITYEEMKDVSGVDCQKVRGPLNTARRFAIRENRIVYGTIPNVGIKRLADNEIVGTGQITMNRIRRMSKRGARNLACVQKFDELSDEEKIRHNSMVSMLGTLYLFSEPKSLKRIEQGVKDNATKELSERKTLELFMD